MIKKIHNNNFSKIILNKRASYEYFIEKKIEAGLALQGWEIKSIRAGKANINNNYIFINHFEAYLLGTNFQPLPTASSHIKCDPNRDRKLLLNKKEIIFLHTNKIQKGYTIIGLKLYLKKSWCKIQIGLAKGKKEIDKRKTLKEKEWKVNKARIIKSLNF